MRSTLITRGFVVSFFVCFVSASDARAQDWAATGGNVVDAAWPGDTPALVGEINVGELAGEGGVSGGSATYSIPINVVPGRGGMQPSVSLNYSSSSGNGIAGMGWSLSAGGAISRCGKTMAQDGVTDKVHFLKATDRLCLNGQRLVAVAGSYGYSGTEYRTELDSFVKVVQNGDIDGTSTSFTVTYRNGFKDYFGQTPDSRQSLEGVTKTLTWMINKSADVSGNNTINYVYTDLGTNDYTEYVLASINYTGEQSATGNRYVEFEYETRPDTRNGFQSGGLWVSTQRLKSITTKYISTKVRKYKLNYKLSATSGNSLLDSAEECGYNGATEYCFPATEFEWYENAPVYKFQRLHYRQNGVKQYLALSGSVSAVLPKKDMNGDGTLDWPSVFLDAEGEFKATNTYENLGSCHLVRATYTSRCFNADFNHDGLTDSWKLAGVGTKTFQYAYANYNGSSPVLINTPITLTSSEEILGISDLNGDGFSDILVRRAITGTPKAAKVEVFLHTKNHAAPYGSTGVFVYSIPARRGASSYVLDEDVQLLGDFDGNGIEDIFVFVKDAATETAWGFAPQWHKPKFYKVLFSDSNSSSYSSTTQTYGGGFGFGVAPYVKHESLFDLNGDGLLDLLKVSNFGTSFDYQINLGNGQLSASKPLGNSATMFSKLKKGYVAIKRAQSASGGGGFPEEGNFNDVYQEPRLASPFVLDYDQNGRPDLMIPYTRVVSFCYDHATMNGNGSWTVKTFCDDEMYRVGEDLGLIQPPLADMNDRSIWEYHAAEFETTGYDINGVPIISVVLNPSDVVAMISQGASADVYGNGHQDLVTVVNCTTTGTNCSYGDANGNNDLNDYVDATGSTLVESAYFSRNTGAYGSSASNGDHYEVVDRMKSATTALDVVTEWDFHPLNTGKLGNNFYDVNQAHLGTTPGYLHFSANISVASQVRHSDGIGGLRAYDYKYRDATLSSQGRGFQGFEQIIVDDVASDLRSVTDYHVKFPLSGDVAEIRRCLINTSNLDCSSLPVSTEERVYDLWRDGIFRQTIYNPSTDYSAQVLENTSTENRYWISPRKQTATHYQTSSSHSAGNGAVQPITVSSLWTHQTIDEQTLNGNSCQTFARSTYQEPSLANQSVVETTTILQPANTSTWWLCKTDYQTVLTKAVAGRTGDYASIETGSDTQKQVKSTITWNTTHRKPSVTTVEATQGGGKPTRTTSTYNNYGLPTSVKIEGTHYNGTSYAMSDRDTTSTYTADGYFLSTVTNDKGHITSTVTDAKYGVPTQVTDPNGQVTTMAYDHFGRLKSSKAPGEPTVRTAYWWCSGVNGGTAWCPSYDFARYRVLQRATGSPDTYVYQDRFDREVSRLVRNFENTDSYRTRARFDVRGNQQWVTNSYPNNNSADARFTYFDGYDNLGRPTQKRTPQANDTHMQTSYAYTGQTVDITVSGSGIGGKLLTMSRKLNGLGQLVSTTDANFQSTEYAYDGAGNPIALEDPDSNSITTSFNALGQKIWVHDPNAGDTDFDYNSLGELEWQQDANNDVITYDYDDLGRPFDRWTNGSLSGRWRYDNSNAYGRKGMIDYEYNSSTTTDRLTKYYRYATTTAGKDHLSYNWHYIFESGSSSGNQYATYYYVDNNYGRPIGLRHGATNIRMQYEFNSVGYMTHIKNASSGYVYREVTAMDALGNVTGSDIGDSVMTQTQDFHVATGQMTQNLVTQTTGGGKIHELEYDYDAFSNLYQSQVTASNGLQNYETFTYDNLQRLTSSDRAYSSESRPNEYVSYEFNQLGNITKKDDYFSTASYGNAARNAGGNAGPNAIRQITYVGGGTTNYTYDNNGNMKTGDGRTINYNEFNKPTSITKGGVTSAISYGADLLRYKHVKTGLAGGTQTTYNIDRHLEVEKQGARTTYRHYIDGVAVLNKEVDGPTTWTLGFNLKDRLGSVVTLADHNGNVLEHRSYDPFGKPRRGDFIEASAGTIQAAIAEDPHPEHDSDPLTDRGFTDHEHLDEQRIIHMNGRVYSYDIGRFTSVDPFIQDPTSSQSLNPYSYIMNNPLGGVDPSGYTEEEPKEDTDVAPRVSEMTVTAKLTGTHKQTGSNLNRPSYTVTAKSGPSAPGQGGGNGAAVGSPSGNGADSSGLIIGTNDGAFQQADTSPAPAIRTDNENRREESHGGERDNEEFITVEQILVDWEIMNRKRKVARDMCEAERGCTPEDWERERREFEKIQRDIDSQSESETGVGPGAELVQEMLERLGVTEDPGLVIHRSRFEKRCAMCTEMNKGDPYLDAAEEAIKQEIESRP